MRLFRRRDAAAGASPQPVYDHESEDEHIDPVQRVLVDEPPHTFAHAAELRGELVSLQPTRVTLTMKAR